MLNIPKFVTPKSVSEAKVIQDVLRDKLDLTDNIPKLQTIAGIDVGYDNARNLAHAAIVLLKFEDLSVIECVQAFAPADFPYIPGFLSFREIPAILAALKSLSFVPDLLMVDGQGIAHPRRMGIAAHLGVSLNLPSIGVAKSCLAGRFDMPGLAKGEKSDLIYKKECIGTVLRSRNNVKPLFISPGHRVSLEKSVEITLQCLTRYRLPEPTRLADKFSKVKKF